MTGKEILVSPVVSLSDIEQQVELPPATEHMIARRGPVELYRGDDPGCKNTDLSSVPIQLWYDALKLTVGMNCHPKG